jgi:SAM-dependent methyltransferase
VIRQYLRRTILSPRWQFARPWLEPLVGVGNPDNQWLRQVMNREVEKLVQSIGPERRSVLEISGTKWERDHLFKSYRSVDYPDFDVCSSQLSERFDLIIAEQVFEHLLWPYRAGRNVFEMLNPGGAFLVTTPFLIRIHNHPVDCSRWTEVGLQCLLHECGFAVEKIVTGSWGNRACVAANFPRWQVYQPWRHSLHNEPDFPVMVWALATKS